MGTALREHWAASAHPSPSEVQQQFHLPDTQGRGLCGSTVCSELLVLRLSSTPCLLQVFSRGELELIADLCVKHDALCISDEVYEWLVYDGKQHIRIGMQNSMADPGLLLLLQHLWAAPSREGTGNRTGAPGNCKGCLHVQL